MGIIGEEIGRYDPYTDKFIKENKMGMSFNNSFNNLCNSCTNIGCEFQSGIVRTECAFYMPPHIEPDSCGNYVVMQSTVETIPKDQYEARLKADMAAILEDLDLQIDESAAYNLEVAKVQRLIRDRIDKLKESKE